MRKRITTAAIAALMLSATVALAADPGPTCEASKLGTTAKYASCRLSAESKAAKAGTPADYSKCSLDKFTAAETKGEGMCPSNDDQSSVGNFLDACTDAVTTALSGGDLLTDPITCASDLSECDAALAETGSCAGNLTTCTGSLGTCNSSLGTCNGNLGTCTGSLGTCNSSLGTCNSDLSTTNADLGSCTGDLGSCTSDLGTCNGNLATANAGTAAVGDVLTGKSFTSAAGLGATGTMPNNGAVTLTPTTSDQAIAAGYHDGTGKCAGDADLVAGNIKSGVNLFGVTGTVSAGGLQKTGQTICYNTAGSVITCAGTGHDGELQKGAARSFTDNGDGTVTDNLTGLMWEKQSDDGTIHDKDNTYTWDNTFASKVATLNSTVFAGHNDWRVPNVVELLSLVSYGTLNPSTFGAFNTSCAASCTVLTCSCTRSDYTWSSSTNQFNSTFAWYVNFNSGYTNGGLKTNSWGFRAVRAGS